MMKSAVQIAASEGIFLKGCCADPSIPTDVKVEKNTVVHGLVQMELLHHLNRCRQTLQIANVNIANCKVGWHTYCKRIWQLNSLSI